LSKVLEGLNELNEQIEKLVAQKAGLEEQIRNLRSATSGYQFALQKAEEDKAEAATEGEEKEE
jgi:hypothetical protein